jgi:hypothetical protein
MFNKYVFNGKYKNGPFFYSKIVHNTPVFPKCFSPVAADFVSKLLEKDPSRRLGQGKGGAQNIKEHPFFNVSSFSIYVTI